MKNVTIKDIAKSTGFSVATVNRAIRDSGYVSQEKRALIKEAILQMGYVPKREQSERKDSAIIAHFTRSNNHPLFSRLSEEIARVAMLNGYYVTNIYVENNTCAEAIVRQIDTLLSVGVKGVIFNSLADEIDFVSIRNYLRALPIPFIMMERTADVYNVNKVLINAQETLFLAVKHLANKNHREIVLFNPERNVSVEKKRIDGFFMAAETFGIRQSVSYYPTLWYAIEDGYAAMDKYLATHKMPTAVIAADSLMVGILQFFYERGIRVPTDVSLVGMDNTFSSLTSPKLSSVAFPEKQMCETAIDMILNAPSDNHAVSTAREVSLSPYLIDRHSAIEIK